jgi:IS1 family transposase
MHFCPHHNCDYRGWLGLNNLRANGHPNGGPWRQFYCLGCNGFFPEHHGTIFYGKQAEVERIVHVLACLAEGLGIRATARVFEVEANTVLHWLVEAAEQLMAFSAYFLCDLHVNQLQLDELYAVLSAVKDGEITETKAIKRLSRSPHWVWVAIDPVTKLLVTIDVGERTQAMAQRFVHHVAQVLAPDCAPLFLTDGFREYATALLTHYGQNIQTCLWTGSYSIRVNRLMRPCARSISASRPAVHDTQLGLPLHLLDAAPETRSHSPFLGEDARRDNAPGIHSGRGEATSPRTE